VIANLVAKFNQGQITAGHLAVECLHILDPREPEVVLGGLPPVILREMRQFIADYRPDKMITNYGVLPAVDQVEAVRRWIESHPDRLKDRIMSKVDSCG
jgi:hypothetical protein